MYSASAGAGLMDASAIASTPAPAPPTRQAGGGGGGGAAVPAGAGAASGVTNCAAQYAESLKADSVSDRGTRASTRALSQMNMARRSAGARRARTSLDESSHGARKVAPAAVWYTSSGTVKRRATVDSCT